MLGEKARLRPKIMMYRSECTLVVLAEHEGGGQSLVMFIPIDPIIWDTVPNK